MLTFILLDQWLWMALKEKTREAEINGNEGLEDDPENLLAKSLVELMQMLYRAQDAKRREMAINVLENFLEESKACTTIDEFNVVIQKHSLQWSQWNFFVNPNIEVIGGSRGEWPLALLNDLTKASTFFELTPSLRDGRVFTNYVAVRKGDDNAEYPFDLSQLLETSGEIVRNRCKEISEAEYVGWEMKDYMAVRLLKSFHFK